MKIYSTGQFAKLVHRVPRTVVGWDLSGKFKAHRTITNRRYYTQRQVNQVLGIKPKKLRGENKKYIYARVSSYGQKDDLKRQISYLKRYAYGRGYQIQGVIYDIGSGMNYKRKNWNKLINLVYQHKNITVIVAYPDRFTRFGFDWFNDMFNHFGSKIEVVNHHKMSPNAELVSDLISIIQAFSSKLYGLRKYKNKLRKDRSLK